MRSLWCKLWNFILNTFTDVVSGVAYALKTVGTVAASILTDVAGAVGSAIGSIFGGSNFFVWLAVGIGGYLLLTKQDDADKNPSIIGGVSNELNNSRTISTD